jgi:hypothetical protein
MSFNNDGQCDYRWKYDDGTKIIFKILFKKFINNAKQLRKILSWDECYPPPPPLPTIVVNNNIYVFMRNYDALKIINYKKTLSSSKIVGCLKNAN